MKYRYRPPDTVMPFVVSTNRPKPIINVACRLVSLGLASPLKRGTKEKIPVPPGREAGAGGSNPNRQTADRYYVCLRCLLTLKRECRVPTLFRRGRWNLVSRFHFDCFHEAITLRNRVYASGTFGENMMPNARVRGLKTRNFSQKYVNIDRLFSPLLPVAKKLAQIPNRGRGRLQNRPRAASLWLWGATDPTA